MLNSVPKKPLDSASSYTVKNFKKVKTQNILWSGLRCLLYESLDRITCDNRVAQGYM